MTEPYTAADVQLVKGALKANCSTCSGAPTTCIDHHIEAAAALSALAEAGRLVPDGAELRARWQVQYFDKAFDQRHAEFRNDRAQADEALAMVRASPRFTDIKLLRKTSTEWVEADEDSTR